ncbi:MAG: hypothetical protein M1546_06950, partial [Chloroflexi bacterium]|nr:hypothetical protein [Chloroflexota bacterium]
IVFDDAGNTGFQTLNKERKYYVLAADGRAWRLFFEREDVIQVTTTNPDDQYTCDKAPGKRPAESGVPWRGFGRVWCGHDDIRMAVGHVKPGADEILTTAAFQSFDNGRAFSVHGKTYVIHLNVTGDVSQETFLTGTWEPVISTGTTAPSKPPAAESPQGPDTCNPRWFFTPRPAGCLQNYRARTAEMQVYQRGRVVYLSDVGQSFVFFDGDSWKNVGAGIDDAGTQHRDRLGEPVGARRTFQSCGGSTSSGGLTTSYIIDADTRILTWAIVASSYTPAGWDYLDDRQFLGCP